MTAQWQAMCHTCGSVRAYGGKNLAPNLSCSECGIRTQHRVVGVDSPSFRYPTEWEHREDETNRRDLFALARLTDLFSQLGIRVAEFNREPLDTWWFRADTQGQLTVWLHPRLRLSERVRALQLAMNTYVSRHDEPTGWSGPAWQSGTTDAEKRSKIEECCFPSRWLG